MNELDPIRAALLALDFQNYGIHPQGYWASHGEPDWPAIARPAVETTAKALAAARRHRLLIIHIGVAWRPGSPEMNMTAPLFANAADRSVEGCSASTNATHHILLDVAHIALIAASSVAIGGPVAASTQTS